MVFSHLRPCRYYATISNDLQHADAIDEDPPQHPVFVFVDTDSEDDKSEHDTDYTFDSDSESYTLLSDTTASGNEVALGGRHMPPPPPQPSSGHDRKKHNMQTNNKFITI